MRVGRWGEREWVRVGRWGDGWRRRWGMGSCGLQRAPLACSGSLGGARRKTNAHHSAIAGLAALGPHIVLPHKMTAAEFLAEI